MDERVASLWIVESCDFRLLASLCGSFGQVGVGGMAEVDEPARELEVDVLGADDLLRRLCPVRRAEDEGVALGAAHASV